MANAALNDQIAVSFVGTLLGQRCMNLFCYQLTTFAGPHTTTAVNTAMDGAIDAGGTMLNNYLNVTPDNYTLDEVWYQFVRPTRYVKDVLAKAQPGQSGFDADTANVQQTVTKRGPAANRRNVGSVHIPCPTEAGAITNGLLTVGQKVALANFALDMQSPLALFGGTVIATPCILNTHGQFLPVLYSTALAQSTVRVLRRRTVGLGI